MFFEDYDGHIHPVSQIRRLRPISSSGGYNPCSHTVDLAGGDEVEIDRGEYRRIQHAGTSVLPAQAGTFLLHFCDDKHSTPPEPFVWRMPVLGFAIGGEGGVPFPLVLDGEIDEMMGFDAILHPCGLVEDFAGTQYNSEESWRAEMDRHAANNLAAAKRGRS